MEGHKLRIISAPYFLATKLEAFNSRGEGDFAASHDLEDVVAVIDGRENIIAEIDTAHPKVKTYIISEIANLKRNEAFLNVLPGFLPPDTASQQRVELLEARLSRIAAL